MCIMSTHRILVSMINMCLKSQKCCPSRLYSPRWRANCLGATRTYSNAGKSEDDEIKELTINYSSFSTIQEKNRTTYLEMVELYKLRERQRRGHVEFIYAALKHMKEFGVEKDLEVYKALIDVFPKGKMIPTNLFQVEFMHYPKHQQCAIDLLEQMEENAVIPDWDMQDQLVNVFGKKGYPMRRYMRMMYWMPKFKNLSPWPLPSDVPYDPFELSFLAIKRIATVDVNTHISVYKTSEVPGALEDTWIISGQSLAQMEIIKRLPDDTPLYVEGRFRIWLRKKAVTYFVLRAEISTSFQYDEEDLGEVSNLKIPLFSTPDALPDRSPTVHEQEDGIILAYCSTGTSSRDSLLSWIRSLEKTNPRLAELPIVFTLKAPKDEGSSLVETTDGKDSLIGKRAEKP